MDNPTYTDEMNAPNQLMQLKAAKLTGMKTILI